MEDIWLLLGKAFQVMADTLKKKKAGIKYQNIFSRRLSWKFRDAYEGGVQVKCCILTALVILKTVGEVKGLQIFNYHTNISAVLSSNP